MKDVTDDFLKLYLLLHMPGIGNRKAEKIMAEIGSHLSMSEFQSWMLTACSGTDHDMLNRLNIEAIQARADSARVFCALDADYPESLLDLRNEKPLLLYTKGNTELLHRAGLSVAGTRHPSMEGRMQLEESLKKILEEDVCIISGLASGCDEMAHRLAIRYKRPTIAVLPSGFRYIAPAVNRRLAEEILESGGLLVSEYEPCRRATKAAFIQRDRLIAALGNCLLVGEHDSDSGTEHTIKYACKMNRRVLEVSADTRDITLNITAGVNRYRQMTIMDYWDEIN